jgi:hypothetical protein
MATKSEAQTEQTSGLVSVMYRPQREIPPKGGDRFFDLTEKVGDTFHFEYLPVKPGRNRIPVHKWKLIAESSLGQQFLRTGVLQLADSVQKPTGDRPGPDDLQNLPVEIAISWIENEQSLFVLKAWEASDYRGEIQNALRQRLAELQDGRV